MPFIHTISNKNPGPFVTTISIALLITIYMVLGPARWLRELMQLTKISKHFSLYVMVLGLVYLIVAWTGEHIVFQRLARWIGHAKEKVTRGSKKRKEYKVIQERMRL